MGRAFQPPATFTASRPLRLGGVLYAPGAAVPAAVVAGTKRASALLSRRWLVPAPSGGRTDPAVPRPSVLPAKLARRMRGL